MSVEVDFSEISVASLLQFLRTGRDSEGAIDPLAESVGLPDEQVLTKATDELALELFYAGHEQGSGGPPAPTQINFYELGIMKGNNLNLRVIETARKDVMGWSEPADETNTVHGALQSALRTNSLPDPINDEPFDEGRARQFTQLSLLPPISSDGAILSYKCLYVFKLRRRGKSGNARFSTSTAPFSLLDTSISIDGNNINTKEIISLASLIAKESEGGSRRENSSPLLVKPVPGRLPSVRSYPKSRWACLMVDWTKIVQAGGGSVPDFAVKFNIHLEVLDRRTGDWVPIIIDPDIGHPGGNAAGP